MEFTQEALVDMIQRFIVHEKGATTEPVNEVTALLRGGLLDSLRLVELTQQISKEFARPIPRGSLMPEDFETPAVLWQRLSEIWAENSSNVS
jgi:acyl carrier protein